MVAGKQAADKIKTSEAARNLSSQVGCVVHNHVSLLPPPSPSASFCCSFFPFLFFFLAHGFSQLVLCAGIRALWQGPRLWAELHAEHQRGKLLPCLAASLAMRAAACVSQHASLTLALSAWLLHNCRTTRNWKRRAESWRKQSGDASESNPNTHACAL